MNNYELVCIFNVKENHHAEGMDAVRAILKSQGASIVKEEDMGARNLAYEINKETRGHYHLYQFEREGEMSKLDDLLKLQQSLVRHLIIKVEKPRKQRIRPPRKSNHHNNYNNASAAPAVSESPAVAEGE